MVILQIHGSPTSSPPLQKHVLSSSSVSAPPASQLLQQLSSDRVLVWNKQQKSCFNMWQGLRQLLHQLGSSISSAPPSARLLHQLGSSISSAPPSARLLHQHGSSISSAPPSAPSSMDSWSGFKHSWSQQ
ncbi:unnamed protein product [Boreogadus saida]